MLDEQKRLISSHDIIVQSFLKKEKIKVMLLPAKNKAMSFFGMNSSDGKRFSTVGPAKSRGLPKFSSSLVGREF